MKHSFLIFLFTLSASVVLAQSPPAESSGGSTTKSSSAGSRSGSQTTKEKEAADRAQFDKELEELVNGLTEEELAATRKPASASAKPATAAKPSFEERRAAREKEDKKTAEILLSELMDAAASGGLERYKSRPGEPIPAEGGGTKPTWLSLIQIPDAEETMCYYKDNGKLLICGFFKAESAFAASYREAKLNAVLKSIAERKGAEISTDDAGHVVFRLGKGVVSIFHMKGEKAGEDYLTLIAQPQE